VKRHVRLHNAHSLSCNWTVFVEQSQETSNTILCHAQYSNCPQFAASCVLQQSLQLWGCKP
jgi:hypothetical protein